MNKPHGPWTFQGNFLAFFCVRDTVVCDDGSEVEFVQVWNGVSSKHILYGEGKTENQHEANNVTLLIYIILNISTLLQETVI